MERNKRLIRNTVILEIGTLLSKGMTFIIILLFSSWLSTNEYGTFDILVTYETLLLPFFSLSAGEGLFRFLLSANNELEKKSIVSSCMVIYFVMAAIGIPLLAALFIEFRLPFFLPFLFLLISDIAKEFVLSYLRGTRKLEKYALSGVISAIVTLASVFILVYVYELGSQGMLYGYALGNICTFTFLFWSSQLKDFVSIKSIKFRSVKETLRYSLPMIPNAVSWWVVNASDRTIITVFLGVYYNGIFAIAHKVPSLCTMLFSVFQLSWQENAVDTISDEDNEEYYNKVFKQLVIILITVCEVIIASDFIIFRYLLDPKYMEAYQYVPILITAVIFATISQFFGGIFVGLQLSKYNGMTTVVAAVLNVTIHLVLVENWGLYASAFSTLICYIVLTVHRYMIVKKEIKIILDLNLQTYIFIYIYVLIIHYINNHVLNFLNLMLISAYFIIINKKILLKVLNRVKNISK